MRIGVSAAVVVAGLAAALAVVDGATLAGSSPGLPPQAVSSTQAAIDGTLPVVAEYRYRLTGKVRLLLLWVSKDGVGGARLRVRSGERDASGLDFLIGDGARAKIGDGCRHDERVGIGDLLDDRRVHLLG